MTREEYFKKLFEKWERESQEKIDRAMELYLSEQIDSFTREMHEYLIQCERDNEESVRIVDQLLRPARRMEVVEPEYVQYTSQFPFTRPRDISVFPN
jgi:hypothetical protein